MILSFIGLYIISYMEISKFEILMFEISFLNYGGYLKIAWKMIQGGIIHMKSSAWDFETAQNSFSIEDHVSERLLSDFFYDKSRLLRFQLYAGS